MLFSFLNDAFNYEERKIDRYENGDILIDTCAISDSSHPYETAIAHPKYNDNRIIIVALYDTKEEAQKGHDNWIKVMTAEKLPESIIDVSTAEVCQILDIFDNSWRKFNAQNI